MGMSEKEFRLTTPRYFYFMARGFEALQLEQWKRARMTAFYSFLPHAKKNSIKRPENLFKLPGEEFTPDWSEQMKEAMKQHLERTKGVDLFAGESIKAEA